MNPTHPNSHTSTKIQEHLISRSYFSTMIKLNSALLLLLVACICANSASAKELRFGRRGASLRERGGNHRTLQTGDDDSGKSGKGGKGKFKGCVKGKGKGGKGELLEECECIVGKGKGKGGKGKGKGKGDSPSPTLAPTLAPECGVDDRDVTPPPVATRAEFICSTSTPLTDGGTLSAGLSVTGPFDGAAPIVPGAVTANISGLASITAEMPPPFVHYTYAIDISQSTGEPCGGNSTGNILGCEVWALKNLNQKIAEAGVAENVALVAFDGMASVSDLDPTVAGVQALVPPSNPGVEAALDSLAVGGSTNFYMAVREIISVVEMAQMDTNITDFMVVFVTDGVPIVPADEADLARLAELGAKVYTFAVGSASECGLALTRISDIGTGGNCTEVSDPSQLEIVLEGFFFPPRLLDGVEITYNGNVVPIGSVPPIGDGITGEEGPALLDGATGLVNGESANMCIEATSLSDSAKCCVDFVV